MPRHYVVEFTNGLARDGTPARRQRARWAEHAALDALAAEGFVLLGRPIGEGEGDGALLVVKGESEDAVRRRASNLSLGVRPWSMWLHPRPV